jgi:dTDP-4-dehydrorhamnose 3,5-epimerase
MEILETPLPGALVIQPQVFGDERGWFHEAWNAEKFKEQGLDLEFCQDNRSMSIDGVLRGLHYQWPNPQGKLVSCVKGKIWDVAVDMRTDSPNYKEWFGLELSDMNHLSYWIPEGFAHGFVVLEGPAVVSYKVTSPFRAEFDTGVRWDDPDICVEWPTSGVPIISAKDENLPWLKEAENLPKL